MFRLKEMINHKILEELQIITSCLDTSNYTVSPIIRMTSEITHNLGDYYELFLAFEDVYKKSLQLFDIKATYNRGKADKANGISYQEGVNAYLREVLTSDAASKAVGDTQNLYCQVTNRLKDREQLADFVHKYRELASVDKHVETIYKAGYRVR